MSSAAAGFTQPIKTLAQEEAGPRHWGSTLHDKHVLEETSRRPHRYQGEDGDVCVCECVKEEEGSSEPHPHPAFPPPIDTNQQQQLMKHSSSSSDMFCNPKISCLVSCDDDVQRSGWFNPPRLPHPYPISYPAGPSPQTHTHTHSIPASLRLMNEFTWSDKSFQIFCIWIICASVAKPTVSVCPADMFRIKLD